MEASHKRAEILVIAGPTASGKSDLALKIAKQFNGEIISADSWTVYKGFDIGTAKPSQVEQKAVKHHLLDVTDIKKGFNASRFKELAEAAISDINSRGKLPIIVGGTGLYIDSVVYDYGFLPNVDRDERGRLNNLSLEDLIIEANHKNINLEGIDTRNKRRIIRAIEAGGQKPVKKPLKDGVLMIGIKIDREKLRDRIQLRVDAMMDKGLEEEVNQLATDLGWDNEPMKGIGYREWKEYFEGTQSFDQTRSRIVSSSMSLAKRQMTWLKRNPDISWFENPSNAFDFVKKKLS